MSGKILRVNLSSGKIWEEEVSEELKKGYVGGAGINAKLLYDALKDNPDADPLGPENAVIFGPGLLAGTSFPCTSRMTITAKSPVTGIFGDSNGGGFFLHGSNRQVMTMCLLPVKQRNRWCFY